ncbi:hypothetical protein K466DRAFT_618610 [Polyporus arcularius HHB13444]|uniref:Uncharacterized protein n=1 Tax=Polyporus arcularius HHB13444 TaxID=1314778 RepID=A0A5C3PDX7_9APHY|nr:hypothetical protein K466DRAFT_618610 [Polyporus arcularius HHB13444]
MPAKRVFTLPPGELPFDVDAASDDHGASRSEALSLPSSSASEEGGGRSIVDVYQTQRETAALLAAASSQNAGLRAAEQTITSCATAERGSGRLVHDTDRRRRHRRVVNSASPEDGPNSSRDPRYTEPLHSMETLSGVRGRVGNFDCRHVERIDPDDAIFARWVLGPQYRSTLIILTIRKSALSDAFTRYLTNANSGSTASDVRLETRRAPKYMLLDRSTVFSV